MRLPENAVIRTNAPFAAAELRDYLARITGRAPLPIWAEEQGDPPEGAIPAPAAFVLRVHADSTAADGGLCDERFHVRADERGAVIASPSLRGAAYGVYAFLERAFGCRFFEPDVETVPPCPDAAFPALDFTSAPAFPYRDVYVRAAIDGRFALKSRLNPARADIPAAWGGRVMFYNYSHSFEKLVPPETYFDAHPEYFSLVNGRRLRDKSQLCLTNPDVLRIVVDGVRRWIRENPQCRVFSVSQNDWYNPCDCPDCRALDAREGSRAGSMIAFVNAVADAIRDEFPDNFIHTFAYLYCRKAPRTVRPRPNVIVRLCAIECCFSHPMAVCDHAVPRIDVETTAARGFRTGERLFRDDLRDWAAITPTLFIWDYVTNFSNYLLPFPNFRVLRENIRLFREAGVKGVFEQGNYAPGTASAFAGLRTYLLGRLLWDPDADVGALTDEYLSGVFGARAAEPLRRALALLCDAAETAHMSIYDGADAPYLTDALLEACGALFAAALAVADTDARRERVEREALSVRYAALARLPLTAPDRDAAIDAFAADARRLGIRELFERRELEASFLCLKRSRFARDRKDVPYAVYRL